MVNVILQTKIRKTWLLFLANRLSICWRRQAIEISQAWGARLTLMMCVKIDEDIAAFEQVSLSGYIPSELNAAVDYDVVVMGSRGFGGMDDSQGSVAKYVAENCPKSVIFAKGMPSDWDEDNNFVGGANTWKA